MLKLSKDAMSDIGCNIVSGIVVEQLANDNSKDKVFYINVYTLYRNFTSCIDGDADSKIRLFKTRSNIKRIVDMFVKDTMVLVNFCVTNGIDITLYEIDYVKIAKSFKSFKDISDFKGLKYYILETQDQAVKALKDAMPGVYKKQSYKLDTVKDMFITTHIGLDLIPLNKHKNITLIESHTGEFKDSSKWYSKLRKYGKNDMSVIPFNEVMYRIYGDNEFVKPDAVSNRKFIYTIANELGWYQGLTSSETIRGVMRKDSKFGTTIKSLFKLIFGD